MSSQNGRVPSKIVKIVHNNSHEQVKHKKGAQEDECYKVGISEIWSTISSFHNCKQFVSNHANSTGDKTLKGQLKLEKSFCLQNKYFINWNSAFGSSLRNEEDMQAVESCQLIWNSKQSTFFLILSWQILQHGAFHD